MWKKIIKGKFEEEGGWRLGVVRGSYVVGVWKEIRKQWDFFKTKISISMDNGSKVSEGER